MHHVAPSLPAVISDTIMNYPTITNTASSNSIHKCPTTTIDLQGDRGNVIHNHTEEVPVYGIRFFHLPLKTISYTKLKRGSSLSLMILCQPCQSVSKIVRPASTPHTYVDTVSNALQLRQFEKKNKIRSFSDWIMAWNTFMQTYLHFKPDIFYKLFTYQKIFCRLVDKYRFDACYAYDLEMMMSLAAELSVAPSQRLHKWEVVSQEYMNIHLQDQLLPPPSTHICYHCHLEGHSAGACPLKKSRMMTNPNANLGSTYSSPPHAHLQSAIHQPIPTTDMANHGQISYAKCPANQIPCQRFNKSGFCAKPPCTFAHICNKCGRSNHAGIKCFYRTSSPFLL